MYSFRAIPLNNPSFVINKIFSIFLVLLLRLNLSAVALVNTLRLEYLFRVDVK